MRRRPPRFSITPTAVLGVSALLGILALAAPGRAQEERPAVVPANGRSIKLEGQVQVQASSSSVDTVVGWDVELRRMRLTLDGDTGDRYSGRIMADFDSNRARVRDAYVDVRVGNASRIRIGQFKPPFNAIETESSKRLLLIERGSRIRGIHRRSVSTFLTDAHYSARNRGIMALVGTGGRWTLQAGAWLGSGEAAENDDGKEVAARLDYRVLPRGEEGMPLTLAAAVVANGFFGPPRDTLRVVGGDSLRVEDPLYGKAVELSAELGAYGKPGLHALVGFFAGDNPFGLRNEGGTIELAPFRAWQGWAEYRIETGSGTLSAVGPAVRLDRLDSDTDATDDAVTFATAGVNLYFGKLFKLQANWERIDPEGSGDAESAIRFQSQVLF